MIMTAEGESRTEFKVPQDAKNACSKQESCPFGNLNQTTPGINPWRGLPACFRRNQPTSTQEQNVKPWVFLLQNASSHQQPSHLLSRSPQNLRVILHTLPTIEASYSLTDHARPNQK